MHLYLPHFQVCRSHWEQLWQDNETLLKYPLLKLSLRSVTLLLLYVAVDRLLMRMTHLPLAYYREPVIFWGFVKHVFSSWYIFPLIFVLVAAIFSRRNLLRPWTDFEQGKSLRFLLTLTAGILAWSYSTYDYNLYFDRAHYADRISLLVLVALIYWRPVFVLPFLTVLLTVIWQFTVLAGLSWAAPFLLIRLVTLFLACFVIQLLTKTFPTKDYVFLTGCLFAAHYWLSGWGKFTWDWLHYDQILLILPYGYSNGWLKYFDPETMLGVLRTLTPFNGVLKVLVLIFEFGAFLFFYSRKFPRFFLLGWISFHLGVLLLSGISFWMWVAVHISLLWLFLRKRGFLTLPIFTRSHIVVSTVLIIGGVYWCKPVQLFWYDLPFSYSYGVEATTTDGRIHELPPTFFSPYDYQFIMSGLAYLATHQMVLLSDVRSDVPVARKFMSIKTADEFFVAEKLNGRIKYHAEGARTFDFFIQEFVRNWNNRLSSDTWFSNFQAPGVLWNHRIRNAFQRPGKIVRIRILQTTSLFSKDDYTEIRKISIYDMAFQ